MMRYHEPTKENIEKQIEYLTASGDSSEDMISELERLKKILSDGSETQESASEEGK